MPSLNKVILLGNITRDPELKKSPSGIPFARLRLAVNEQFRDRATGQPKEVACYVDVAVWDRQAETCCQFLQKGSQVLVDGRLIYEEWKTPTGEARSRLSVRADRVQFLANTRGRPGGEGQPAQQVQRGIPENQPARPAPAEPAYAAQPAAAPMPPPANDDDENLPF